MPDEDTRKRQAYAAFLEGTAERLHVLLKRRTVAPQELSGDIERHLISALEILSETPVEFIDNDHQIGYRFMRSSKPKPSDSALEDLVNYPIWKAVQKNLTDPDQLQGENKKFSIEDQHRIVMEHLDPECRSEELCNREGISADTLARWTLKFLDAGRDTLEKAEIPDAISHSARNTPLAQQVEFEIDRLKEILARLIRENIRSKQKHIKSSSDASEWQSSSQS